MSAVTKPRSGSVVTISYDLTPENEFVPVPLFDSRGTIVFVLDGGNYLPGLHELVSTMTIGERVDNVKLDAGWGAKNPDLIAKIAKDGTSGAMDYDQIKVGTQLRLANGMNCVVTNVTPDDFTIDANPPLAGASYSADVELLSVEDGPTQFEYQPGRGENGTYQVATFALGCFWGGELEYMRVPGVVGTSVGYTQGTKDDPTYEEVCSGTTGHTEAIQVIYDSDAVTYESLVKLGMDRLGDSRYKLNQVGNDRGTQYRHGIYYHNDDQKEVAESVLESYGENCVTECKPATKFFLAEDYHQQYLLKGGQSAKKGDKESIRCYG